MQSFLLGKLLTHVTENDVRKYFAKSGELELVRICRNPITMRSMGIAYVKYVRSDQAARAFAKYKELLHGRIQWSMHLRVHNDIPLKTALYRIVKQQHPHIAFMVTHLMVQQNDSDVAKMFENYYALDATILEYAEVVKKVIVEFFLQSSNKADMQRRMAKEVQLSVKMMCHLYVPARVREYALTMIIKPDEVQAFMESEIQLFTALLMRKKAIGRPTGIHQLYQIYPY